MFYRCDHYWTITMGQQFILSKLLGNQFLYIRYLNYGFFVQGHMAVLLFPDLLKINSNNRKCF